MKTSLPRVLFAVFTVVGVTGRSEADVIVNFSNKTFAGGSFEQLLDYSTEKIVGTLTGVSVNATLNASSDGNTWASDLTVYVDVEPLSSNGLLEIAGFPSRNAVQSYTWAGGLSSAVGTILAETITLNTPLVFTGDKSIDGTVFFGNGFNVSSSIGTWSGSLTLLGVNSLPLSTGAPVPEPGSLAFVAVGGIGVLMRRRRQMLLAKAS